MQAVRAEIHYYYQSSEYDALASYVDGLLVWTERMLPPPPLPVSQYDDIPLVIDWGAILAQPLPIPPPLPPAPEVVRITTAWFIVEHPCRMHDLFTPATSYRLRDMMRAIKAQPAGGHGAQLLILDGEDAVTELAVSLDTWSARLRRAGWAGDVRFGVPISW